MNLYYVIPELRGQGLGAALDRYIANLFQSEGIDRARLSVAPANLAAIGFYMKMGWNKLGLREDDSDFLLMEKHFLST